MMIEVIDSHVHLEEIKDLENAIKRARDNGVIGIIGVSSDLSSCKFQLEISKKYNFVFPAIGVHPWNLMKTSKDEIENTISFIKFNVNEAVGIGEVGLDFWYKEVNEEKKKLQIEVFEKMLEIAEKNKKPIIIHSRGAWEECFSIVKDFNVKAIFHWYSGPIELLKIHDVFISATPAVLYSKEHQTVVRYMPLERILLETDSPVKYRGKEAEPVDVLKTLEGVAKIKEMELEKVAKVTLENTTKIFGLKI